MSAASERQAKQQLLAARHQVQQRALGRLAIPEPQDWRDALTDAGAQWLVPQGAQGLTNATYTLTSSPVGATSYSASNVVAANAR